MCEIFESHASQLKKLFKFNPKKCNPASSFSGCVHRDKSRCLIALPTEAEHVKVFEKTLIGGFSCVNKRLTLDSQILLLKGNVDKYKLIFDLKINNVNKIKRITTKILKMDENNQYGHAMTKPMTKTYQHYTFEQAKFTQDFVLMNQKARQKATSPVEKDFYKLLNKTNFGIDCRNNIDNCKLEPIFDEVGESCYIKKFDTIFGSDDNYRNFYCLK